MPLFFIFSKYLVLMEIIFRIYKLMISQLFSRCTHSKLRITGRKLFILTKSFIKNKSNPHVEKVKRVMMIKYCNITIP